MCPTCWLTRFASVKSALDNYNSALEALQKAAANFGSVTASPANGIHCCLSTGKCVLGLYASLPVLQALENLNKALQGSQVTVSGMLAAVERTNNIIQSLRTEQKFKEVFETAQEKIEECQLEPVCFPRNRKMPKRLDEGSQGHSHISAVSYYGAEFYKVIDSVSQYLNEYFTSSDITEYRDLSDVLLSGSYNADIIKKYPEVSNSLRQKLEFFHSQFSQASSVEDYIKIFVNIVPEVRRLFAQVERLPRLLLISPASSCEAERSFNTLRRMKTWLCSTMTQKRLNHLMVCNIHKERLAALSPYATARKFVQRVADTRLSVFGEFEV